MNCVSILALPKSHLKSTWLIVKEVLIWCIFNLLIVYFFILTTPFLFYRRFVTFLVKMFDKDVTTSITGLSAMFHRDFDCYHKKPLHTVVTCLRFKGGNLSLSKLQQAFLEKVVLRKDSQNGHLLYPELQQYFTRFMGYSFLKIDRKFDIENHVTVYRDENEVVVTRPLLTEIWENLMSKPYHKERSPWEAVLVENYVADETESGENAPDWIVFVRLHHGIADGFCFEKIISNLMESDYVPDFTSISSSKSAKQLAQQNAAQDLQKALLNLRCLVMGPYDLLNRVVRYVEEYHSLHFPASVKSNEYFVVESEIKSVKEVKQIKQRLGVGFTTVLLAVASGAIRKFLIKNAMPFPELFTVTIPYPSKDKREDKLGNDFFLAGLSLPIDMENQQSRVLNVQQSLENLRYSSFMKMLDVFMQQITNLPSVVLRAISRKSMFSASYSSIPGPSKIVRGEGPLAGCDLIEANFTHGLSSDSLGFAISTITFAGNLRMTLYIERNLVGGSREKAELLGKCLMEEYSELKTAALG